MDAIEELNKRVEGEDFDDMNVEDVQELLVAEDTDEANLVKMPSWINEINSKDCNTDRNDEVRHFTQKMHKERPRLSQKNWNYHFLNEGRNTEGSKTVFRELPKCLTPCNINC